MIPVFVSSLRSHSHSVLLLPHCGIINRLYSWNLEPPSSLNVLNHWQNQKPLAYLEYGPVGSMVRHLSAFWVDPYAQLTEFMVDWLPQSIISSLLKKGSYNRIKWAIFGGFNNIFYNFIKAITFLLLLKRTYYAKFTFTWSLKINIPSVCVHNHPIIIKIHPPSVFY